MRFEMDISSSNSQMQMQQQQQPQQQQQHILSAAEGGLPVLSGTGHGRFLNARSDPSGGMDRDCRVALEERELWSKFQELTNEMIVTKNGR